MPKAQLSFFFAINNLKSVSSIRVSYWLSLIYISYRYVLKLRSRLRARKFRLWWWLHIIKNNISVSLKNPKLPITTTALNANVTNVQLINNQIILTGTNLDSISTLKVSDGTTTNNLQSESQSATSLVANTIANVTFAADKILNFIQRAFWVIKSSV